MYDCMCENEAASSRCDQSVRLRQARTFRYLANEHNFWNRSTVLKKHQILSRSLKNSFSGNFVNISERLPGHYSDIAISILVCSSSFLAVLAQISNPTWSDTQYKLKRFFQQSINSNFFCTQSLFHPGWEKTPPKYSPLTGNVSPAQKKKQSIISNGDFFFSHNDFSLSTVNTNLTWQFFIIEW